MAEEHLSPHDDEGNTREEEQISGLAVPSSGAHHSTGSGTRTGGMRWVPPTAEEIQPLFPSYEIIALIGQGGMGAVYKARQPTLDRMVAIKLLPLELAEDEVEFAARFENEARVLAQMNHPGIVRVFEFGQTTAGQLFMVMEFIEGTDVSHLLLPMQPLPQEHAAGILLQMCDALGYAHSNHVIHRDIKPSNVMLTAEGRVKLMDFGLAKNVTSHSLALTKSHVVMGTPDYIAPEALLYGVQADHRADIYALGVMFYQMLTGVIPRGKYKAPSERVAALDNRFDIIVRTCMAENPLERYQDITGLRRSVEKSLNSGPQQQVERPATSAAPRPQWSGPQPFTPPSSPMNQRLQQPRSGSRTKATTRTETKSGLSIVKVVAVLVLLVAGYFIWQEVQHQPQVTSTPAPAPAAPPASTPTPSPAAPAPVTTSASPQTPSPAAAPPSVTGTMAGTAPAPAPVSPDSTVRLIAPAEGEIMDNGGGFPNVDPTEWDFTWSPVQGAEGYELRVFYDNIDVPMYRFSSAEPHYFYSMRGYTMGNPPPTRRWSVRAIVGGAPQPWSEIRSFQLEPVNADLQGEYAAALASAPVASLPPEKVALVPRQKTPLPDEVVDNGTGTMNTDLREWTFTWDPVPDASRYQLLVRKDTAPSFAVFGTFDKPIYEMVNSGYMPGTELLGWEWRVRAEVRGKWEAWSDASPFTIELPGTDRNVENQPPPAGSDPALTVIPTAVPDGTILENREARGTNYVSSTSAFTWQPVTGATLYQVFIVQDGAPYPTMNGTTTNSMWGDGARKSVTDPVRPFRWKVRARVSGVWQPWCREMRFMYKRPGEPDPVMPAVVASSATTAPSMNNAAIVRDWTDTNGRTIRAAFAGVTGDRVTLVIDGKTSAVPLSVLSEPSQRMARTLAGSSGGAAPATAAATPPSASGLPPGLPPVLARYTFEGAGPEPGATLSKTIQEKGSLVLNGEYEMRQPPGYKAVFPCPDLDYAKFTVAVRLRPERLYDPLLVGGTAWRWLCLRWAGASALDVQANQKTLETLRVRITEGRWITLVLTCDLAAKELIVYANGKKEGTIKLEDGFQFSAMGTPRSSDKLFTFTNYSTGGAFKGEVDELVVFGGVLEDKQVSALRLGADAR